MARSAVVIYHLGFQPVLCAQKLIVTMSYSLVAKRMSPTLRVRPNNLLEQVQGFSVIVSGLFVLENIVLTAFTYSFKRNGTPLFTLSLCGELVQCLCRWTPGPGVLPAGVRPPDSERKYLWDALCLPPTRRRSEVGGAEPEI